MVSLYEKLKATMRLFQFQSVVKYIYRALCYTLCLIILMIDYTGHTWTFIDIFLTRGRKKYIKRKLYNRVSRIAVQVSFFMYIPTCFPLISMCIVYIYVYTYISIAEEYFFLPCPFHCMIFIFKNDYSLVSFFVLSFLLRTNDIRESSHQRILWFFSASIITHSRSIPHLLRKLIISWNTRRYRQTSH